ncbi:MAG: LysM peptidoglycan-binding domain-containing protein [Anaerolinea sp.]|nr:LysM peptidoglycan-binding domain-containing protein [Anaerolinea sp.]
MPVLRLLVLMVIALVVGIMPAGTTPNVQPTQPICTDLVARAIQTVGRACDVVNRNQACYGNRLINVEFRPEQSPVFTQSGDVADIQAISRIGTTPFDEATSDWGIAIIKAQANLSTALPGENVTFLLFGDASLDNPTPDMQAVTVRTDFIQGVICEPAPSGVVIQSPAGSQVEMTLNGADVVLGSTVYMVVTSPEELLLATLEGTAVVIVDGEIRVVAAGSFITLPIDEDFQVDGEPSDAAPLDPALVQYLPLELLDEPITLPEVTEEVGVTRTPTRTRTPTPTPSPTAVCFPRTDWTIRYTVQSGDTLGNIAQRIGISTQQLAQGNCIANPDVIIAGTTINVPVAVPTLVPPSTSTATATTIPTVTFTADQYTLNAGQCTTIRWNVPGQTTYISAFDQSLPPQGSQTYCPYGTETIDLYVGRPDDSTEQYSLTLTVVDICGDYICGATENDQICPIDCPPITGS